MTRIRTGPHLGPYCNSVGPMRKLWPSSSATLWDVTWQLGCSPNGLVLTNVSYGGKQVFFRASLPILRVQYDAIWKKTGKVLQFIDDLNEQDSSWIDIYEGVATNSPSKYFAIDAYYDRGIGNYRIQQRWVFWDDGTIYARLYSRGEQWPFNHRHHAYWRFYFDVVTSGDNVVLEGQSDYDRGEGWGGWSAMPIETMSRKITIVGEKGRVDQTRWAVVNQGTRTGYEIVPGANDGAADDFSRFDFAVQRYHDTEDLDHMAATAEDDHMADFTNGEDTFGQDVVVWYVAHLFHDITDKGRDWHETGPNLNPIRVPLTPVAPPNGGPIL
jgi:hypothetical protein